jgi:ATP adenylyltransferase
MTQPADPHPQTPAHPDAVWAPWRLQYLESLVDEPAPNTAPQSESPDAPQPPPPPQTCFLADYWAAPDADEDNHVLVRSEHGMILLNAYPYANGHLLVALGEGRPRLLDYDPDQRAHLWSLVDRAADLVERALEPQGINIGINQGRAAGAGVPGHLHVHLLPRWGGDVNFITTVGQVRVIPSSLEAMAARYRRALARA